MSVEDLIKTVLEHALERVADESRAEAFPKTFLTLLADDEAQTRGEAFEFCGVDL